MSNSDLSFSFSLGPASQPPDTEPPRYIGRPFEAHSLGEEALVLAVGDGSANRLPMFYPQALQRCDRFRTLPEHADLLLRDFGIPASEKSQVVQGLKGLVERDLLRSEPAIFEQLIQAGSESGRDPIDTLCIRTCNRPEDLQALLTSLSPHAEGAGLKRVLILDDGPDESASAASAAAIAAVPGLSGVRIEHIDRGRRTRILEHLCKEAGADQAALSWLIDGDSDDPEASYGSNLNLGLLLTAGQRFWMIDDDALLDPHQIRPPSGALSLRVSHNFETRFPDPTQVEIEQYQSISVNPLAEHANHLGQPIGKIIQDHGLQDGHLLRELSPQMIYEFTQRPRVRLTTNGTLGDTGSGDLLWLFALPAKTLEPWLTSPETYAERLYSRRVARSVADTEISASVSLMTTTLTGVDNSELLLPVGAKGRGEDLVFGALIRFLHPGTPCAALPWMLPHRRDSVRRWDAKYLHRPRRLGLSSYLATRIEDLAAMQLPVEPESRAGVLAAWMRSLEKMSDDELIIDMQRCLLERRAKSAVGIGKTLSELNPPAWLRSDFMRLIDSQSRLDAEDTENLPQLARAARRFGRAYAAAIESWLICWHCAARQPLDRLLESCP